MSRTIYHDIFTQNNFDIKVEYSLSKHLKASIIESPLGQLIAVFDENFLYLLEFTNRKNLLSIFRKFQETTKIVWGENQLLEILKKELQLYFEGKLKKFTIPVKFTDSIFRTLVWEELINLQFGQISTYKEIACKIGNPKAVRAVANSIASNNLVIIIPCHRVISSNGNIAGYSSGVDRKKWLLSHEDKEII